MIVKPLHRNVENISLEMLAREIETDTAQQMELRALEKLAKNEALIVKVQRAMNNWVRVKLENRMPTSEIMKDMVTQASSEYEGEGYNPLKCWNEQETEKEINTLVKVLVTMNREISLSGDSLLKCVRDRAMVDPLLQTSLQKQRLD